MLQINFDSNINEINIPVDLKLTNAIIDKITEIVRFDIEQNYEQARSYDGSTIAPKKGKGRLFYQTGTLLKSVSNNVVNEYGEVFINSQRSLIAEYLQIGRSNMPERHTFGVSNRITSQVEQLLQNTKLETLFGW